MDATYKHSSGVKVIPGDISFSSLDGLDLENLDDALLDLEGLVDYHKKNNTAPPCWEIIKVSSENCTIDEMVEFAYSAVKIAEKPE